MFAFRHQALQNLWWIHEGGCPKCMPREVKNVKNPFRLTLDDALHAAIKLVKQEHGTETPCAKCQETLTLLKRLQGRLDHMAIASNLVWYAMRGERRIDVRD